MFSIMQYSLNEDQIEIDHNDKINMELSVEMIKNKTEPTILTNN